MTISESGTAVAGDTLSLTCTVDVSLPPAVQWIHPNSSVITNSSNISVGPPVTAGNITNLTLTFNPLLTSHGGQYTCQSEVDVGSSVQNSTHNITVRSKSAYHLAHFMFSTTCVLSWLVGSLSLGTSRQPNETLYVNQNVTLTCTAHLPPSVDTSVTVVVTWSGPRGVYSSTTTTTHGAYTSTVSVDQLQTSDSGNYTCSAIASPDVSSTFVAASTNTTSVLNIVVGGKTPFIQSLAK